MAKDEDEDEEDDDLCACPPLGGKRVKGKVMFMMVTMREKMKMMTSVLVPPLVGSLARLYTETGCSFLLRRVRSPLHSW